MCAQVNILLTSVPDMIPLLIRHVSTHKLYLLTS
jgi:hypothetical protein